MKNLNFITIFLYLIFFTNFVFGNDYKEKKMSHYIIVSLVSKENKKEDLKKAMVDLKRNLPKVNGCLSVSIFQDKSNSKNFTIVEEWDSSKSHRTHIDNITKSGDLDKILQLLEKPLSGIDYLKL